MYFCEAVVVLALVVVVVLTLGVLAIGVVLALGLVLALSGEMLHHVERTAGSILKILRQEARVHEMHHTGERPFKRSICGTGFTGNERLLQHISGAH